MDQTEHDLADLIGEFLALALNGESREQLEAQAAELGLPFDQLLTMSLAQLILSRFRLSPAEAEESEPEVVG